MDWRFAGASDGRPGRLLAPGATCERDSRCIADTGCFVLAIQTTALQRVRRRRKHLLPTAVG